MRLLINDNKQIYQPDPFIVEDNGMFYIFSTGINGVNCFKSKDLLGPYEYVGIVFYQDGFKEYWAPAVIKTNEKYYMYVSNMPNKEDDTHTQALKVACCDKIDGQYEYVCDLCEPFSIDAHPVINDEGMFMFYSINKYEGEKVGTRIVVDKMMSPTKILGNPKEVVLPSIEQEIFMKNRFKEGQDWYTIEGACYFFENGTHYLLYSANCYQHADYFVGYSMSNSKELDLTKIEFKKYPSDDIFEPILVKNDFESGTGHNSVIKYNNEWYVIYHGRDLENEDVDYDNRNMRIAKLDLVNNKLLVKRYKEHI